MAAPAGCRVEIFIKELVEQFEYQAVKTQNPPFWTHFKDDLHDLGVQDGIVRMAVPE